MALPIEMTPALPVEMSPEVAMPVEMSPAVALPVEMSPARAEEESASVINDAQRVDLKRFMVKFSWFEYSLGDGWLECGIENL